MDNDYKFFALTDGTTGIVVPINDSKTAEDIFDALDDIGVSLSMLLTTTKKEAEDYLNNI
jgi:hypothetical protein